MSTKRASKAAIEDQKENKLNVAKDKGGLFILEYGRESLHKVLLKEKRAIYIENDQTA